MSKISKVKEGLENNLGQQLSLEVVRSNVPRNFRANITEEFLAKLESGLEDEEEARVFRDNFISYSNVLNDCSKSTTITDYVNAVKFVSFKIMGYSIDQAWSKVFVDKASKCIREGKIKNINRYANTYNKDKLVNKICEQTMIPSYVLNQPLYQRALNVLGEMIENDEVRGMAKVKACETILNYTKPPEVNKAEVKVSITQNDAINDLREVAEAFAATLRKSIEEGKKTAGEIIDIPVGVHDA